uniref:Uncharacterized protein n=1 Tax=Brassica oleracea TaxID=3712 RepID=A0A3P6ERC7_BRAOL|nr:unnamed protein product [Brassica oleracea]
MHTFFSYTMGMVRRDIFYIPEGAIIGDTIVSGTEVPIKMENALPLKSTSTDMPLGTAIHNI